MDQISQEAKHEAAEKLNQLLRQTSEFDVAVILLQALDMICDVHQIELPEGAVSANIALDEHFGCDVLSMR